MFPFQKFVTRLKVIVTVLYGNANGRTSERDQRGSSLGIVDLASSLA